MECNAIHYIICFICRPDLVDFSKLNKERPEANLEYAFNVAEKEFKVPRLLDVEGNSKVNTDLTKMSDNVRNFNL